MMTAQEKYDWGEHNLRCAQSLDSQVYPDWVATIFYYSAMHFIDSIIFNPEYTYVTRDAMVCSPGDIDAYRNVLEEYNKRNPSNTVAILNRHELRRDIVQNSDPFDSMPNLSSNFNRLLKGSYQLRYTSRALKAKELTKLEKSILEIKQIVSEHRQGGQPSPQLPLQQTGTSHSTSDAKVKS